MDHEIFIVQPYVTKATGLVAQPAQMFPDAASARRAGGRLSRWRAGVVVLSQRVGGVSARHGAPKTIAVYGAVPEAWRALAKAA